MNIATLRLFIQLYGEDLTFTELQNLLGEKNDPLSHSYSLNN